MIITDIKATPLIVPYKEPYYWAQGVVDGAGVLLVEIKTDKDGNLGSTIGRKSFSNDNLLNNFNHLIDTIKKEKPDAIKGEFIKNVYITSTMGISYKAGVKR